MRQKQIINREVELKNKSQPADAVKITEGKENKRLHSPRTTERQHTRQDT
jgi:hypothetical protein